MKSSGRGKILKFYRDCKVPGFALVSHVHLFELVYTATIVEGFPTHVILKFCHALYLTFGGVSVECSPISTACLKLNRLTRRNFENHVGGLDPVLPERCAYKIRSSNTDISCLSDKET